VIWAPDESDIDCLPDRSQFMASMPTYVGKSAQRPALVTNEKDTLIAEIDGSNLAWRHQLIETPDTNPGPLPEVLLLPLEDVGRGVCGRGKG
jgi:hypothetical protein